LSGWEIGRDLRDEKFMLRIYFLMIFYFQWIFKQLLNNPGK
jgi:hypothetical protein